MYASVMVLSLCALLWLSVLGCVFVSMCFCLCDCVCLYLCVWVCLCVSLCVLEIIAGGWMPAEWRQMNCHKSQRKKEKWAGTGGSQGPGDSVNVRLQESDDIFARTLEFPQDLECGWEQQVRSVLSRDFKGQDGLPPNWHLASGVSSPFCSWESWVLGPGLAQDWRETAMTDLPGWTDPWRKTMNQSEKIAPLSICFQSFCWESLLLTLLYLDYLLNTG